MRFEDLAWLADPDTESFLLPPHLVRGTNRADIEHYKLALRVAMNTMLTPEQRDLLHLRYWKCLGVTDIARLLAVQPSAVSKRIKKAEALLAEQLGFYRQVRKAEARAGIAAGGE